MFSIYFQLGLEHILDWDAYDHILFVIVLAAVYKIQDWKKVAILVTAFTIGHSLTLALSALDYLRFSKPFIEFLIPVTILLTAVYNFTGLPNSDNRKVNWKYLLALFFGLIHGMAFSNVLRSSLMPGEENSLITQLFGFNVGVEVGQLVIVGILLIISYIFLSLIKLPHRIWNYFISGAGIVLSIKMILEKWPF